MLKKALVLLLLMPLLMNAQDSLKVSISPKGNYNKVMLYAVVGANQNYVASTSESDNGVFKLEIPKGKAPGIYRLYYDTKNRGYFDFLYNSESISVSFDASSAESSAVFETSEENILYQSYLNDVEDQIYKVDSIQFLYLQPVKKIKHKEDYKKALSKLNEIQAAYEKQAKGKLAYHFIKSNKKYKSPEILEEADDYLATIKDHYFDYLDFSETELYNSSFFIDEVIEFVFFLNGSDDEAKDTALKEEAINTTMKEVGNNYVIKTEILTSLIYALAGEQEVELTNYLINNYYKNLPAEFQNKEFIQKIESEIKTSLGVVAPEITWEENGETKTLTGLKGYDKYLLIFWSTSCSHCMMEIPKIYDDMQGNKAIKVIAVALESNREGFDRETPKMPNWIHVLGLNKWDNELADLYGITSTPSYFILDAEKRIIAKPNKERDVENYFSAQK